MLWDPVLKLILLDSVLVSPMNSARDPEKKTQMSKMCNLPLSKLTLSGTELGFVALGGGGVYRFVSA